MRSSRLHQPEPLCFGASFQTFCQIIPSTTKTMFFVGYVPLISANGSIFRTYKNYGSQWFIDSLSLHSSKGSGWFRRLKGSSQSAISGSRCHKAYHTWPQFHGTLATSCARRPLPSLKGYELNSPVLKVGNNGERQALTSTPQIPSNRYHKALNRGTLGGLGTDSELGAHTILPT